MKKLLLFLSLFVFTKINAQNYERDIEMADSLMAKKDYQKAAATYAKVFHYHGGAQQTTDRYNAAVAFGHLKNADTVVYYINRLATRVAYYDYEKVVQEPAFQFLKNNEKWIEVCEKIKKNGEKLNFPLMQELEKIHDDDQSVRNGKSNMSMTEMDAINLPKIEAVLEKYGWVGKDIVGSKGNSAIFLVIQHSNLKTMEKYLPMAREARAKGNLEASSLALMEDRTLMWQGKKQIYGSQIKCVTMYADNSRKCDVHPIEDAQNVDKRRADIGLKPMSEYVKSFGLTWDLREHIKAQEEKEKNDKKD